MKGLEKFKSVFSNFTCLKKLNLNNNKLCNDEDNETKFFKEVLIAVNSTLESLSIAENSIDDNEMNQFLLPALQSMKFLKELDLSRNPITADSIIPLYQSLIDNDVELESLNLTGC